MHLTLAKMNTLVQKISKTHLLCLGSVRIEPKFKRQSNVYSLLQEVIDTDSSGVIEFDEFVQIFKAAKNNKKIKSGKIKFQEFASILHIIQKSFQAVWGNSWKVDSAFKLPSANIKEEP